jgi:hypothetical protein
MQIWLRSICSVYLQRYARVREEMNESNSRMTKSGNPPSDSEISEWIGNEAYEYWKQVRNLIERIYPNIFTPEWLFGGKKHGWSLRYKKSKSF